MTLRRAQPTGREVFFGEDELIVSKTDTRGIITYANDTFVRVSGYSEKELIGVPHSIIRHPHMPRCVFKLLWDTIFQRKEIFAYVVNLTRTGEHYWVLAHVTPSFGATGEVVGYHSSRRVPLRAAIEKITPIYATLCDEEKKYSGKSEAIFGSLRLFEETLQGLGMSYDEFVWSLTNSASVEVAA